MCHLLAQLLCLRTVVPRAVHNYQDGEIFIKQARITRAAVKGFQSEMKLEDVKWRSSRLCTQESRTEKWTDFQEGPDSRETETSLLHSERLRGLAPRPQARDLTVRPRTPPEHSSPVQERPPRKEKVRADEQVSQQLTRHPETVPCNKGRQVIGQTRRASPSKDTVSTKTRVPTLRILCS